MGFGVIWSRVNGPFFRDIGGHGVTRLLHHSLAVTPS